VSFAYALIRIPIQVSDSLTEILEAQQFPSAYALFVHHTQRVAYMRPLRHAQIKLIYDLGARTDLQLAYRGFHALLLAAAIFLFIAALDVRT
jgi:hypothetical protein